MAVTGLGLAGFVLAHLLGNLQMFGGRHMMNTYAATMQGLGPLLWVLRGGLLFIVLVHIGAGLRLIALNRQARPVKYKVFKQVRSRWYSRYMGMTGIVLLVFITFHILHFTVGAVQPEAFQLWELPSGKLVTAFEFGARHDAYGMFIAGFSNPGIAGFYLLAMALLCMHLSHGVTSFLQTLGINHPKYNRLFAAVGPLYGWAIFLGNVALVAAVLAKWVLV